MFSSRPFVFLLNLFLGVSQILFFFISFPFLDIYLWHQPKKKNKTNPSSHNFCQSFLVLASLHCQYCVAKTMLNNNVTSSNQPFPPAFPLAFGICKLIGPQAHVHPEGQYCRGLQFPMQILPPCSLQQLLQLREPLCWQETDLGIEGRVGSIKLPAPRILSTYNCYYAVFSCKEFIAVILGARYNAKFMPQLWWQHTTMKHLCLKTGFVFHM